LDKAYKEKIVSKKQMGLAKEMCAIEQGFYHFVKNKTNTFHSVEMCTQRYVSKSQCLNIT
jgi:hypothetical protein